MSYRNDMSIGEAIEAWLKSRGFEEKVQIERVIQDWPRIMGRAIAENTDKVWFNQGTFFIRMRSPVWKNELAMAKSKIRDMLNREIGQAVISQVRIL